MVGELTTDQGRIDYLSAELGLQIGDNSFYNRGTGTAIDLTCQEPLVAEGHSATMVCHGAFSARWAQSKGSFSVTYTIDESGALDVDVENAQSEQYNPDNSQIDTHRLDIREEQFRRIEQPLSREARTLGSPDMPNVLSRMHQEGSIPYANSARDGTLLIAEGPRYIMERTGDASVRMSSSEIVGSNHAIHMAHDFRMGAGIAPLNTVNTTLSFSAVGPDNNLVVDQAEFEGGTSPLGSDQREMGLGQSAIVRRYTTEDNPAGRPMIQDNPGIFRSP